MDSRAKTLLLYFTLLVVCLYFLFWGLVKAKGFLAPISVAALLAMVILPVANWLEKKGLKRGWASLLSDLLILLFFVLLAGVIGLQIKGLSGNLPKMQQKIEPKISQLQDFIKEKTGIDLMQQMSGGTSGAAGQQENGAKQGQQQQQQKSGGGLGSQLSGSSMMSSAGSFLMRLVSFIGTFLLTFVYIFFFLLYRRKFKTSVLKMVPEHKRDKARDILSESVDVSKNYLFGRLLLIVFLAVIYSIGLSVTGVQQAILISILAAVLTLIPYIGNIIGYGLAISMALFSGAGLTGVIGVSITFAVTQFVESYILEPYIVGDKVNINPVFTIIVVVLGGAVWGVVGMLIAIPTLGIAKVVFDHIPVLNPLGYLFGQEDIEDDDGEPGFFDKVKSWALNKFSSGKQS